jgi:predicted nucleotidyltransferase
VTVLGILTDVTARFDHLGIRYAVGGSLASSVWGQARQTNDADIAVSLTEDQVGALLEAFTSPYQVNLAELEFAVRSTDPFRTGQILHTEEGFKIDLFLLRDGPYEESELERAVPVEVLDGVFVRFSAPENTIVAKLRWFDLGNRVSDRQWNDIVQVLEVQGDALDEAYLTKWAEAFGVDGLLGEAWQQTRS